MKIRFIVAAALLCGLWSVSPSLTMAQTEKSKSETAQVDTLARAKEISAVSGRPIFAVAGRST